MLYDPKWEKNVETKVDPFALDTLIAWLENQPANKAYSYCSTGRCLLAQYFTAHGFANVSIGSTTIRNTQIPDSRRKFPDIFEHIVNESPMTFGAALKRAHTALASA